MTEPHRVRAAGAGAQVLASLNRPHVLSLVGTAGLNVATVAAGSVGGLVLAGVLGASDRGDLVSILLWPAVLGSLASIGLNHATCYWVARDPGRGSRFVGSGVGAAAVTGVALALAGPWLAGLIARDNEVARLMSGVLALAPIYIAGGVWMGALQATSIRVWNLARAIQPCLYLLGVVGLALVGKLTLASVAIAFGGSLMAQTAFAALATRSLVPGRRAVRREELGLLYGYGVKVWLASVPQLVNIRLDLLVLSVAPSVTSADVGVYAVAASLSWLALPAATAFGSVAFPRLARADSGPSTRRVQQRSIVGAGVVAGVVALFTCVAAPVFVPALFGDSFEGAIDLLWILAPGTVFLALTMVVGDLLQGRGHPLVRSVGEGIGAVLTVLLLSILVPEYGLAGAAFSSSVTYGVVLLVLLRGLSRLPGPVLTDALGAS